MGRPTQDEEFLRGFGDRMQARCDQIGISSADLARMTGFHKAHVSMIRNGKTNTNVQALRIICDALDVSADYLLGIDTKTPDHPAPSGTALMQAHQVAGLLRETADLLEDMVGARIRVHEAEPELEELLEQCPPSDDEAMLSLIHKGEFSNIERLAEALGWDRTRARRSLQRLTSTNRVRYEKREAFQKDPGGTASGRKWVARGVYVVVGGNHEAGETRDVRGDEKPGPRLGVEGPGTRD